MEVAEAGDEEDNPPLHSSGEQLPRSNSPGLPETDLTIHPPANFTLPVINTPSGSQAFLTEAPSAASSPGAGGLSKPISSPMGTPSGKQRSSKTLAALHAGSVPGSAAGGTRQGHGSVPSSPQPTHRLPPIGSKLQQQQQLQDTESPLDRASPNLPPSSSASSKQLPTAAAADPNRDMRNFDGKDLHDLIKIGHEDYNDVARLQSVITMQLSSKTTEAAKAEALLQIRQAAMSNPFFSMTPALYELVKEHLNSRNRILRPCAAYALAGYAANSRHGRGLMAVNAAELLPRLNAMLKCKVDSLDARCGEQCASLAYMYQSKTGVAYRIALRVQQPCTSTELGRGAGKDREKGRPCRDVLGKWVWGVKGEARYGWGRMMGCLQEERRGIVKSGIWRLGRAELVEVGDVGRRRWGAWEGEGDGGLAPGKLQLREWRC